MKRMPIKLTHKTYRESLQNNQDIIRQSLELATDSHDDGRLNSTLDALKHREPNRQLAYALFRELEFSSLTREFADTMPLFAGLDGNNAQMLSTPKDVIRKLSNTREESG